MTVEVHVEGQKFIALNGGPDFKFTEAAVARVHCKTQEEVDKYWDALTGKVEKKAPAAG